MDKLAATSHIMNSMEANSSEAVKEPFKPATVGHIKKLIASNPSEAKIRLERLLQTDPEEPLVNGLYSMLMLKLEKWTLAQKYVNKAVEVSGNHYPENFYNRAWYWAYHTASQTSEAERLKLALADVEAAINREPPTELLIQCYELRAIIHEKQEAKAELLEDYKMLAELTKAPIWSLKAGNLAEKLGNPREARSTYRQVVKKTQFRTSTPNTMKQQVFNLQAKIDLFESYKNAGQYERAHNTIQEIIELFPEYGDYYFGLGNFYLTQNTGFYSPAKAIENYNLARERKFQHPLLPFNLGFAEARLKHYDIAKQYFMEALAQYPIGHDERRNIYLAYDRCTIEYLNEKAKADISDVPTFTSFLNDSFELIAKAAIEFSNDEDIIKAFSYRYPQYFLLLQLPQPDLTGVQAMHAARCGNKEVLQKLLSDLNSARVNYQEPVTDETVLHAVLNNQQAFDKPTQLQIFKSLQTKGFDLTKQDSQGNTVFHIACLQKNIYMLIALLAERKQGERYLLRADLDLALTNKAGETVEACFKKIVKKDKALKDQPNVKIVSDLVEQFHENRKRQIPEQMAKLKI